MCIICIHKNVWAVSKRGYTGFALSGPKVFVHSTKMQHGGSRAEVDRKQIVSVRRSVRRSSLEGLSWKYKPVKF